ncbi:MAG TPA: STAS domain-containing protein [Bacteroidota bacterium]|nr:STAS domain-containing protein [Bacteroidota bacterium]
MAIRTEILPGGVGIIEIRGSMIADDEVAELRRAVAEFVDRRWRRLLIDFSETMYLNSTAIGVLVAAHTSYTKRDWLLKLCSMNKHVHVIFAITNLNKIFSVYDTRGEALSAFEDAERRRTPGQ